MQGLGLAAAFSPAGRAGLATTGMMKGGAKVGAASAATQGGLSGIQQAVGRDASSGEIATEVAFAGLAGGAFESLSRVIGSLGRSVISRIKSGSIDDATRKIFIEQTTKLGIPADEVTDDFIRQAVNKADDVFTEDTALNALEQEFKVKLSNAQRSGNQAALSQEDAIRSGTRGSKAQDIYLKGEAQQSAQISKAADAIQGEVANGAELIGSRQQAGSALKEAVKIAQKTANAGRREAYSAVGDATIDAKGLKGIFRHIKKAVTTVDFDPALPETGKALKNIKGMNKLLAKMEGSIKPFHIKRVELFRKRLNKAASAAEKVALTKRKYFK